MTLRPGWALVLLVAMGGLLRAGYLVTPIMDSDQATFGLQARHVLLGEFPIFSWGYAYVGTLQSFVAAVAFAVFGASRLVLNAIPLLLSLLFVVVVYQLGREMGGHGVGLVAASLVALAPPYLAIHGAWARHGYMDTILLGTLVLLVAFRLSRQPLPDGEALRLFALLGLVGGLAWWTNVFSLFYLAPAAGYLLLNDWRCVLRRGPWVALGFFVLGSAPFWAFNLVNAFWSFAPFKGGDLGRAPLQLLQVVTEGLPAILAARASRSRTHYLPVLSEGLVFVYAGAFVWLGWRQLSASGRARQHRPGLALLLIFFVNAALLLAISRFGEAITAEGTKRYLLPLYSALPLLYALFLADVRARSRRLAAALLILPLFLHLYGNLTSYPFSTGDVAAFRLARAQDAELFGFLRARGLTRVYAPDYWQAPLLTFDAGEKIIFAEPFGGRYAPYTELVDSAPRVAYLFSAGAAGDFVALLEAIGVTFDRTAVGPYEVFHDFRPPAGVEALRSLPARGWRATASSTETPPALAFDRDVDTAWYSGEAQRPGLFFQVDLQQPVPLGKVVLLPPRPSIGFPRGYRIELSRDGRRWEETAAVGDVLWSLDWDGGQPRMAARGRVVSAFEPREVQYIRIHQTGSHPTWWWAIGELFVYGPAGEGPARPAPDATAHLERGAGYQTDGRVRDAIGEYWRALRLDPELEIAHGRLAGLYERAGIPLDGAASPAARAAAFEAVGLWAKAVREYEKEIRQAAYHRDHTNLWRRLLRAHREARAQGEAGDDEWARRLEAWLGRAFSPSVPASVSFGNQLRFLGYRLEPESVRPGRMLRLTYYWQALRSTPKDYVVFVHFLRDGRIVFQHDHAPLEGVYPTSHWRPGEVVRESFELVAPDELEAGSYEIVLGVWDPETGRRLLVTETPLPHKKDRVVIGHTTVEGRS